ncbi:AMP-binding enzyme family protein [Mycobacterium xenopi 3993]|nr:AMP-binding enzyme family protein [Mycobacterium xenopi 3993]
MAEGLLSYTRLDDPPALVDHTQGRPMCADDELRILDDAGQPVAPGVEGELLVRALTRSTATSAPSTTTGAASTRTASTAPATWSAGWPTAIYR